MSAGCTAAEAAGRPGEPVIGREPESPGTAPNSSGCATVVTRVSASDFRNLRAAELLPGPGVNLLVGDNGQGKTNLMEALWLFTGEKSFRGARDGDLTRFGQRFCRLELEFTQGARREEASLAVGGGGKQATLGGVKLESASELAGRFTAVVFSPEDLTLAKGGPQARRRFLNAAIAQLYPRYGAELGLYANLLRQRNALLKDIPQHAELLDTLEVWDERLAVLGGRIAAARLRYVARLSKAAAGIYQGIARSGDCGSDSTERITDETLEVSYACPYGRELCAVPGDSGSPPLPVFPGLPAAPAAVQPAAQLGKALAEEFKKRRRDDLEAGFTTAGPHRDDLELLLAGRAARLFASQGQQRSVVLALKLAEARVLAEIAGCAPVLLLDDVMSELDRRRQDYLLHHIGGAQVFITCCDPGLFAGSGPRVFRVRGGEISPEQNTEIG